MKTPHKHAALIKAWADGAEIEVLTMQGWLAISSPCWGIGYDYRIKPESKTATAKVIKKAGMQLRMPPHQSAHGIVASENITGMKSYFDVLGHYKDGWKDGFFAAQPPLPAQQAQQAQQAQETQIAYQSLARDMTTIAAREVPRGLPIAEFAMHALADAELLSNPKQLERKPLTDERIKDIYRHIPDFDQWVFSGAMLKFARAIEAALKEKNT